MMSFVPFIDEATVLAKSLCDICLAGAFIGCILMLFEAAFVLGFGGRRPAAGGPQPPVTVLKPLHGSEPELTVRLTAFCVQDYGGPVQVLCGARDANAPVANAVRTMQREHPDWPIELHTDPRRHGSNRKLSNLINMFPRIRHDTLVLSDSDIVVEPSYLRDVASLLAQPRAGAVTTLYHGIAAEGLWARLSALAINTHFLPQAITGLALKAAKPCFGATVALRRSTLEKIGGFGRFADELADDYAMGMAVRSAGYDVVIAPFLVGHVCFETSLRQFVRHQIRVARTIKSIDPIGYAGTILTHPWPLALLGMLSGSTAALLLAVAALASRIALCRCVERRFGLERENYWLVPLHDILAFAAYVASYFGATVHWRGADYRVATDGTLIEDDPRCP
jgi:ceramide glucosyltransferase